MITKAYLINLILMFSAVIVSMEYQIPGKWEERLKWWTLASLVLFPAWLIYLVVVW